MIVPKSGNGSLKIIPMGLNSYEALEKTEITMGVTQLERSSGRPFCDWFPSSRLRP
jgi:hypothetical protein